jgi:CXXX repeat modification system protein
MAKKIQPHKKLLGKVMEQEKEEIKALFERKNGLSELFKIVPSDNAKLYEKIVKDMGETSSKFQKWWDDKSKQYNWDDIKGYSWEIDFNTCEIFLVKQSS